MSAHTAEPQLVDRKPPAKNSGKQGGLYALQDEETGLVALDIDLSVLSLPRAPPLVAKLLGSDWRASLSVHAIPPDISRRRILSLAEYKKSQGIA